MPAGPHHPDAPAALPIRLRDRILVPPAPRDTSLITGFPARRPQRRMVDVPDPRSGRPSPMALWHYRAPRPDPREPGPTTPPLVMVHGFRGDHHGLALIADCLPEDEIIIPDLPGFGHSPAFPDAGHSVADYAAAVGSAVGQLGLDRSTLVGHSFGSVIAAHLAVAAPQSWAELVLLNPICEPALSADGSPVERVLARLAQGYYAVSATLPEPLGAALLSAPPVVWFTGTVMAKTRDRRTLAYLHDQHQQYFSAFDTRQVLVQAYRASVRGTVLNSAETLTLPVLLVAGAQDALGSVAGQRALADRIAAASPRVELEVLDGVGHLVHYERAPQTAALIREFRAGT